MADRTAEVTHTSTALPFLATATVIVLGWLNRDEGLLVAENGAGYMLGIAGGLLLVATPLYSLRKRIRPLRRAGRVRHWFRAHMAAGVLGPVLILFHCNFAPGSTNSAIALGTMLVVVASGVVGRSLYTRIHRGLYGRRLELHELALDSRISAWQLEPLLAASPQLKRRLAALEDRVAARPGLTVGVWRVLAVAVRTRWTFAVAAVTLARARFTLRSRGINDPRGVRPSVRVALCAVQDHLIAVRRVALFGFYERLFSLWHLLHVPLFFLLVVSATVHVVAVHLY